MYIYIYIYQLILDVRYIDINYFRINESKSKSLLLLVSCY